LTVKMGKIDMNTHSAKVLVERFGTRDPFVIAKETGVNVMFSDKLKRLKGMYFLIKRNRFIVLNSKNSEQMNRIVCAHELGHDRLHREYAADRALQEFMLYDMSTRREYEANMFAAELLLDDEEILEYIRMGMDVFGIAAATSTDINLVALKVDCLINAGYRLRIQEHDDKFLK